MIDGPQWSAPFRLFGTREHLNVSGKTGVYRIRAFNTPAAPRPIPRFAGVDTDGILHIGKSINLGRRIRQFRQAAEGLKASMHAGSEFYQWKFTRVVALESLWADYAETPDESEALRLERALCETYRQRFLDRPPLDSTSGQILRISE